MKQFVILSLALCLSAAVFSSCNNEDNTPEAPSISFKDNTDGTFYAKAGFPLTLTPQVENGDGAQYSWTLGGQQVGTSATYTFQSDETGTYALTLTVKTAGGEATQQLSVTVEPVDVHYRPATQNSLAACNARYEYTPAPGQFINEPQSGFKNENTPEAACAYALERMGKSAYVSLGGFGGYLIVGFDHSIDNEKGADFSIAGNSFSGSSEPGIVYVMQDENGNGKPDDTWYELKGSEYGKPETLKDYSVTYYKPQSAGTDIRWEDNEGNEGMVYYLPGFHKQDTYYPAWITADSYTLSGTRLATNSDWEEGTGWVNKAYDWGYADNFSPKDGTGSNADGTGARVNNFEIDNAVKADGTPAGLRHIDFVKIQTGVHFTTESIGELSTEVLGVKDLHAGK